MKNVYRILLLLLLTSQAMSAQSGRYGDGMKFQFGKTDDNFLRLLLVNQVWVRYMENNPGTAGADGLVQETATDIGVRRSRILLHGQMGPRILIFTHIGINNQTFRAGGDNGLGPGKKPPVFVHDAWGEYEVVNTYRDKSTKIPFSLYVGSGLHYWNGLSRLSSAGIPTVLTLDLPILNFPEIEQNDQFGREMGVYAKGDAGKFHYVFNLNKPFVVDQRAQATTDRAFLIPTDNWASSGHVEYHVFDMEGHVLPFRPSTYLGTKKILNIGAGYYHHPASTGSLDDKGELLKHDKTITAVDVFAELPVGDKQAAFTAYSVLYNYNYGLNYYRSVGIMNNAPATVASNYAGSLSIDGFGNAESLIGTGQVWYTQLGILMPKAAWLKKTRLQPFGAYTWKKLDYLGQDISKYDLGLNWLVDGQNVKFSLQYSNRPVLARDNGAIVRLDNRGQWIFQNQFFF